jgi:hypothetical protein
MKIKINWKYFFIFFIVIGGLYYITGIFVEGYLSRLMVTAGVMLILLLIDGLLRDVDNKRRGKKQMEDILKHLDNNTDEDEETH